MHVSVVSIGNSKGIRIPKAVLDQLNITDKLEMEIVDRRIILNPVKNRPRAGWEKSFRTMSENGDDAPVLPESIDTHDFEWEW